MNAILKVFEDLKEEMNSTLELSEFILCLLERKDIGFIYNGFYDYNNEEQKTRYLSHKGNTLEEWNMWEKESEILLRHGYKHLSLQYLEDEYGEDIPYWFTGVIELDGVIYIGDNYEDSFILNNIRIAKVEKKIIEEILYS